MKAREAAYVSLLASLRNESFVITSLERWQRKENPPSQEFNFAYEIAAGSARMALALDFMATQLSSKQKLTLKLKERALLRTAIYQHCFMDKVPLYAIVNETIEIAKKYFHRTFVGYLNALLRKLEDEISVLPQGQTAEALSIRYSYPLGFVEKLLAQYGQEAIKIMEEGNKPPVSMVRIRHKDTIDFERLPDLENVAIIKNSQDIKKISASSSYYIQNATPIALVKNLAERTPTPKTILDLCAAPGGKLLAAHDYFPEAELFANDVSQEKLERLSQNLAKYGVKAHLNSGLGEEYPLGTLFDLIILDVPCSNSGVLNKRPEARWRLDQEAVASLVEKQKTLIRRALSLLNKDGVIWYMTCSILDEENVTVINQFASLQIVYSQTILPNATGWDGGFGALLKLREQD